MEIVKYCLGLVFVSLAVISDYKIYKIKNVHIMIFLIAGLIFNLLNGGLGGGIEAIMGALLPLVLFPLYALKMLGAGDIKAFCAIGSILGFEQIGYTIIFSFMAGGVIAVFFLVFRENALARFKAFWKYIYACFYMRRLLPYSSFTDPSGKFRFAYGIFCGFILSVINNYYQFI